MNRLALFCVISVSMLFAAAAYAEDSAAPAKAAEESKPAPAAAPEAKAEPAPAASAEKPLGASAARFQPVLDAYQQAHDNLLAFLRKASAKMEPLDARIAELKKKIAEKAAKESDARLAALQKHEPIPPVDSETQKLIDELKSQEARQKELSQAMSAAVEQKVQESNKAAADALPKAAPENP